MLPFLPQSRVRHVVMAMRPEYLALLVPMHEQNALPETLPEALPFLPALEFWFANWPMLISERAKASRHKGHRYISDMLCDSFHCLATVTSHNVSLEARLNGTGEG